ncbi:hypothetical protein TanjilG_02939 [Lupinus angustifolius]|uniref:Uncharacterized protein n=1 Tax=Lupinus angustifolius TaxID=3871 RepID=A0A1J7GZ64_LUPAN|nr:hypothetical protein TanjilG_02939 [Lupinus angustifolius]
MTQTLKSDFGQEAVQAKQTPDQTKFMTKLTKSRAIWSGQMHQDVGQEHQGAERPGLTETGRTRLGVGVVHMPAGRGQALSQALGAQSGQLGVATLAQP